MNKFEHCKRFLFAAFTLAALSGCMVGPDYVPPKVNVPDQFPPVQPEEGKALSITNSESAMVLHWWKSFNDPVLESLINEGIESNLDLKQAVIRIRQARASRGVVGAGFWPTLDTAGSYRRSYIGGEESHQPSGGVNLWQARLDAAWELDIFGGVRRDIEAAEADIQAAIEDRRDIQVTLAAEIALNYIDLRGLQEELVIARRNLELQQRTAALTRRRFEGGFVSGLDVANSDALVATTLSEIPALESATLRVIHTLSVLLGREPTSLVTRLSTDSDIPSTPPQVPIGIPSDILRRRPDLRRTEAQLHAASARIGVATADLFPRFSISGTLGLQADQLVNLGNWSNRFWSLGPTISWPVFDAGRIRANIAVQNAREEALLIGYEKTVLNALREVDSAIVAYAKEQERRHALDQAVIANRKAVDLATQLYTQGQTDFLNVLNAQRSLLNSEDAYVQSTRNISTNLVALYKALGGGWTEEEEGKPAVTTAPPVHANEIPR